MAVKITGSLSSPVKVFLTHESGSTTQTIAPKDNGGDGSTFSPTDLCVASYGACVTTIVDLFARKNNIPLKRIDFELFKEMTPPPRRIGKISGSFILSTNCSDEDFARLEDAGRNCPVALSLSPAVVTEVNYVRA